MNRKSSLLYIVLFALGIGSAHAQIPTITPDEINLIIGNWKGSLTYLDYSTKKSFSMPAELKVNYGPDRNVLLFFNTYPNEPQANSVDTVVISSDGRMLDKEVVQSKKTLDGGHTEIITEHSGVDGNDNEPALIRYTYILGKAVFIRKKEVLFDNQSEWINRHQFSYSRK